MFQQLRKQIEANKHLKSLGKANRRSEVGTIVILCGTWFRTIEDLNKHIESVHASFDLSNFPKAHKVPAKPINPPAPDQVNSATSNNFNAGIVQIRGVQQVSLEEYAKSKTYERPTKNDSTDQVLDKLKILLTRFTMTTAYLTQMVKLKSICTVTSSSCSRTSLKQILTGCE